MDTVERKKGSKNGKKGHFRGSGEAMLFLSASFEIRFANRAVTNVTGYNPSELSGKHLSELIPDPDLLSSGSGITKRPVQVTCKNKKTRNCQIQIEEFTSGKTTSYLLFISSPKVNQKFPESANVPSRTTTALLNAIPDSVLIQNYAGDFIDYYPSLTGSFINDPSVVVNKNMSDFFSQEITALFKQAFINIKETGHTQNIEFSIENGETKYYEARLTPLNSHRILTIVRDITESESVQRVLNIRNRALEAAGNGILISDAEMPDNPIIFCNEAFTAITGYTREEVIGKNCRFLQGEDRQQPAIARLREAIAQGKPIQEILRNYRKDGSLFWNELTITPVTDHKGKVTHFIGVQNDVSNVITEAERKDQIRNILEQIIRDEPLEEIGISISDFLSSYIDQAGLILSLKDPHSGDLKPWYSFSIPKKMQKLLSWRPSNDIAECGCEIAVMEGRTYISEDISKDALWGELAEPILNAGFSASWSFPIHSSKGEILGSCSIFSRQSGAPDDATRERIRDVLQLGSIAIEKFYTQEMLLDNKEQLEAYAKKLEKHVKVQTREVESAVKKLAETNLNLEDQIETTREAEKRARTHQTLFAAIARNFPKGVIMVFDQKLRLQHLEGEELAGIGLSSWNYKGKTPEDLQGFTEVQKVYIKNEVIKTLQGEHRSFEQSRNGRIYSVNSTPLVLEESVHWALLVWSNVTEQKTIENELLKSLKTEQELNDLKSRFIAMASHEFRTPLSAILSSAILIGKQMESGKEDKRNHYLNQIKNNVRNLNVILNDFMSISRLEEGEIKCEKFNFDLIQLIRAVLEELESNLKVGQYFIEECEMGNLNIYSDPKLMRHVLLNLISNAIKYSPENSPIHLHIKKRGSQIIIAIQDRGIGIPEEEQSNLFRRFFRAKNAVNIPGTGLGLHLVKHYLDLMGGYVHFKSKLNKGSTFYIHLPTVLKSPKP